MDDSKLVCRGCGSSMTKEELKAGGWINCCPERAMNEVIEERYISSPALVTKEIYKELSEIEINSSDN